MRSSTVFISAGLTAFVLAILAGVVLAYQAPVSATELSAQVANIPTASQPADLPIASATAPAAVTPQQAAALAAQVMNKADLYSVESAVLNAVEAYKVTFSSGDVVFVSLDGQILSVVKPQTVIAAPSTILQPAPAAKGGGGGAGQASGHGDSENEGHDD